MEKHFDVVVVPTKGEIWLRWIWRGIKTAGPIYLALWIFVVTVAHFRPPTVLSSSGMPVAGALQLPPLQGEQGDVQVELDLRKTVPLGRLIPIKPRLPEPSVAAQLKHTCRYLSLQGEAVAESDISQLIRYNVARRSGAHDDVVVVATVPASRLYPGDVDGTLTLSAGRWKRKIHVTGQVRWQAETMIKWADEFVKSLHGARAQPAVRGAVFWADQAVRVAPGNEEARWARLQAVHAALKAGAKALKPVFVEDAEWIIAHAADKNRKQQAQRWLGEVAH